MSIQIFWFRRDLRLQDNAGLYHALKSGLPVLPIFIFDRHILDELEDRADGRVAFIHHSIRLLHRKLNEAGGGLEVHYGNPVDVFTKLLVQHSISSVITNHDYEPYARDRDETVRKLLSSRDIELTTYKDHVIFEKQEVSKDDGSGYSVYTPFSRKWKSLLTEEATNPFTLSLKGRAFVQPAHEIPSLREIGFDDRHQSFENPILDEQLLSRYEETRNFPAVRGTSRIGMHLRFGTISIRSVVHHAKSLNQTFLNELIWREFLSRCCGVSRAW